MDSQTLEQKVNETPPLQKLKFWDALIAAYSGSKTVQTLIGGVSHGYGLGLSMLGAAGTYVALKSVSSGLKYLGTMLFHPLSYPSPQEEMEKTLQNLNPVGKYKLPTTLGGTMSALHYVGM